MPETSEVGFVGGCSCGAVRYRATGAPLNARICHCRMCQKAIGAAFNARVVFRLDDVEIEGGAAYHHTSEALERGFCPRCGTTLFSRRTGMGIVGVTAGSLDDVSLFQPDMHFWVSSKQPWLKLDDGLPQYPEGPPPN
jgi:hypothetical protein